MVDDEGSGAEGDLERRLRDRERELEAQRAAARALQHRLAAIVESSHDAIVSKTLDGIVVTWNAGATRTFGYTSDEMVGQPLTRLIPDELADEEPFILARLARGERVDHFETVRVRKDGARIHVALTISPVRDEDGRVIGVSKIARDITSQKRALKALEDETRTLELLVETGQAIGSRIDLAEVVQSVTDAATRIAGAAYGAFFYRVTREAGEAWELYALAGAPREAFEPLGKPRNTRVFEPTFRGLGVVRSDDITRDPRYGSMGPHHGMPPGHLAVRSYLAAPVVSRAGEVMGALLLGHPEPGVFGERLERLMAGIATQAALAIDNARLYEAARRATEERDRLLHAERAARAAAERANLSKDEFLSTLSHELRTPLNAILGWSQLLHGKDGRVLSEGLRVIERNAKAQTALVEDLLDVSRIVAGQVRLDVRAVDLAALVRSAVEALRLAAEAKAIALSSRIEPIAGVVLGDARRLEQCVGNVLGNAIKFTPRGGAVTVMLTTSASGAEVRVADDGEGIAPEFLPHVFERFRQADASTTRAHGGLGIGLALVKHVVELHGGTVQAESLGPGRGATFAIVLPFAGDREAGARRSSPPPPPLSLAGLRVLVVDDDADARELVRAILERDGAEVVTAVDADDALAQMEDGRFDVWVSDLGMPRADGFDLARRVRGSTRLAGIPSVALSAFARTDDRVRALGVGYRAHLAKPVEPSMLAATIARVAGR